MRGSSTKSIGEQESCFWMLPLCGIGFAIVLYAGIHYLEILYTTLNPCCTGVQRSLLEPGRYIWLLKALYGLLMLLPQQSAAFKILQTRLRTVPSYSFGSEQLKRTSSGDLYSQNHHNMPIGSHITEDGDMSQDTGNMHNGINFVARLQQFEHMQRQHRMHTKSQLRSRNSSSATLSQEVQRSEEPPRPSHLPDMTRPPSRSSWRGPGQL